MATLTVRGLKPEITAEIRRRAELEGKSMNRCIIELIESGIVGDTSNKPRINHDFDHLFGTMSEEDARCLDESVAEGRVVEEDLWS